VPAEVEIDTTEVIVAPGGEEVVEARLRNLGAVTDTFSLAVVGSGQGWTVIDPPLVTLFPGAEQTVRISMRPPRSSAVSAGESTMTLRVVPHGDPDDISMADVVVRILSFDDRRVSFLQPVGRGRERALFDLVLENDGNTRATCRLSLVDDSRRLAARFDPPAVAVEPGGREVVRVRIAARRTRMTGQPQPHLFSVKAVEDGHPTAQASATFLQAALIPERLGRWVIGAALLVGAAALAWVGLVKPAVDDAAEQAATRVVNERVAALEAEQPVTPDTTIVTPDGEVLVSNGVPWDEQWTVSAAQGDFTQSSAVTVDPGRVVRLTDVFWSNEAQDTGTLSLLRDGEVVLQWGLGSNRNWAQAFRNGIEVTAGGNLAVQLECDSPGDPTATTCQVAFTLFGVDEPAE
jgi:P pilus assembly chaperone PapD